MTNRTMKDIEDGIINLIWKKVNPQDLKPGDHIYAYKQYGIYSHHGISVGGGYVIHFTSPANKVAILSLSRVEPKTATTCPECGYRENTGRGVIKTCLDCFRRDGNTLQSIHYFMYGVPLLGVFLKKREVAAPFLVPDPQNKLLKLLMSFSGAMDLVSMILLVITVNILRLTVRRAYVPACRQHLCSLLDEVQRAEEPTAHEVRKVVLFPLAISA